MHLILLENFRKSFCYYELYPDSCKLPKNTVSTTGTLQLTIGCLATFLGYN